MNLSPQQMWHSLTAEESLARLGAEGTQGLSNEEAKTRLQRFGQNRLTPKRGKRPAVLFLSQFHDPLIYILLVSARR